MCHTMAKLPQECSTVITAGGFEPVPVNAGTMPPQLEGARQQGIWTAAA
jgi:hypothetical protein